MITFIIFTTILSVLIIVHEFGHFIMAKKMGVRVEKFSLGFGPTIFKKKNRQTEYSVCSFLLGGYVKMAGDNLEEYQGKPDEYLNKKPGQRAAIVFFGPLLNYILGILVFWLVFVIGFPTFTTKIGAINEGYGAKEAGLRVNDKILSVDGKKVGFWEDLQKIIHDKTNNSVVKLTVLRENKEFSAEVKVKTKEFTDILGNKHRVGVIGVGVGDEIVKVRFGVVESLLLGLNKTWELTEVTYAGLWQMIIGKLPMRESVTGPLGIFYITSKAASVGTSAVLHLVAVLSISLAIFNLLPFPILDGGHLLFLLIEKIRGKALSLKVDRVITQIGFSLIITLAIFITCNDVVRFFGDKIIKFLK